MSLPYYSVNVLTGTKSSKLLEDASEAAGMIKKAKRPLLVIGPLCAMEYLTKIAQVGKIPVVATANTKKRLVELGVTPDSTFDTVEIINHLKKPDWQGVKGEGNHDLVIFSGIRCDLAERGLSTLKHFAPHLKTFALCRLSHPNANYALPILNTEKWKDYLESVINLLTENN
ncbi:MAG: hypothetical protein DDT40_00182 [candidate division WS2 bacterium]|nr:hypothetical protein [Candidatus Psychracetigena formicireducens]